MEKRKEVPAFGAGFLYTATFFVCVLNYTAASPYSIASPERRLQGSQLQFFFFNNLHCTVRSTVKGNTTMFGYHFAGALIASADSMPMHRTEVWEGVNATIRMPSAAVPVILHLPERKSRARELHSSVFFNSPWAALYTTSKTPGVARPGSCVHGKRSARQRNTLASLAKKHRASASPLAHVCAALDSLYHIGDVTTVRQYKRDITTKPR